MTENKQQVDCSDCLWRVDTILESTKKRPSADRVSEILKRMRTTEPGCCCQRDGDAHSDVQHRFCAMLRGVQR